MDFLGGVHGFLGACVCFFWGDIRGFSRGGFFGDVWFLGGRAWFFGGACVVFSVFLSA